MWTDAHLIRWNPSRSGSKFGLNARLSPFPATISRHFPRRRHFPRPISRSISRGRLLVQDRTVGSQTKSPPLFTPCGILFSVGFLLREGFGGQVPAARLVVFYFGGVA